MGSMSTVDKYPNWFKQTAQPNFEQHLLPLAEHPALRFLQLGAYTGDASVWMLENILTDRYSKLTDVDTWRGSDEEGHKNLDFDEVYKIYLNKISKYKKQINVYRCTTTDHLLAQYGCDRPLGEYFDFIYVDADHTTVGVLLDAELSWPLLKSGGIMAFDDYTWGDHYPMHQRPKPGIDLFLLRHSGEYDVLAVNLQYWIRKH
jgi:predicted O-methyltransferase YrrM